MLEFDQLTVNSACRKFTTLLQDMYFSLKQRPQTEDFEIVFLSHDIVDMEYEKYTAKMPWWCLPHCSPAVGRLASLYGAMGVPHLVVLDANGSVILDDGVQEAIADPQGWQFPWRPKTLKDLLPTEYIGLDRRRHAMAELDDKYLMLYFTASWCNPCQTFIPKLRQAYEALKQTRNDFEVRGSRGGGMNVETRILTLALARDCERGSRSGVLRTIVGSSALLRTAL